MAPEIDARNYADLLGDVLRRIPIDDPEWTDFNESDPGVTLLELFAFLTETLLSQSEERQRQCRRRRARRLALLVVGAAGASLVVWRTAKDRSVSLSTTGVGGDGGSMSSAA